MASFAKVEVEGGKQLRKALEAVGDDLSELRGAHQRVASAAAEFVRSSVPVGNSDTSKKPGALRSSVKGMGSKTSATVKWGRKAVPYAAVVEFGGWPKKGASGGPGRPFIKQGRHIYPAVDTFLPRAIEIHEQEMRQIVSKFNAKQGKP